MAHPCRLRVDVARARLARLGLTQTALARLSDVELRTMQRWFAGAGVAYVDAEGMARALGVGTHDLFDGIPESTGSVFTRLRDVVRLLGNRNGTLAQAVRISLEQFAYIDEHVAFTAHPAHGFVHRIPIRALRPHGFAVLHLRGAPVARYAFHTQLGARFRYAFGEIQVAQRAARLVEHFHTRTSTAALAGDGEVTAFVWIPKEMRELVIVADHDLDVALDVEDAPVFDLRDPRTAHAVCFRPAPMHLRDAGLPPTFDRVVGPRAGRIDADDEALSEP